jgi:very-short-patch-repair endonuclease
MSLSERVLWYQLRKDKLGFRFKRQVRVGPYFLDFYCPKAKLCVEVDGEQHEERVDKDAWRDKYLLEQGIETMRIPSLDLFDEAGILIGEWVTRIEATCQVRAARNLSPRPPLQDEPLGEGVT